MQISIIVVTYNQEETIGRTLDSILSQRYEGDFEIVIGDDASTDRTGEICRDYAARYPARIRYIGRERNLGVVRNYFDCIEQSRGEYLADCAGDDFWVDSDKLQKQSDYLDIHPEVSLVATNWLCCDPDGSNPRPFPGVKRSVDIRVLDKERAASDILAGREWIHLCSALYRKENLLQFVRRNPEELINADYACEDLQILVALAVSGRIAVLPDTTLHYSVGHASISHQVDYGRRFDYSARAVMQKRRLQTYFELPEDPGIYDAAVANIVAMAFRCGDSDRMKRAAEITRATGAKTGVKSLVYNTLSHLPGIWWGSRQILNRLRP